MKKGWLAAVLKEHPSCMYGIDNREKGAQYVVFCCTRVFLVWGRQARSRKALYTPTVVISLHKYKACMVPY